jgi:malate dehydrogenase
MPKVAFVGAGNVGASAAVYLAETDLADMVLIDVVDGMAAGKALDMLAAGPLRGFTHAIDGTTDLDAVEGADVVLTTAGLARKPGMDRMDLLKKNAAIMRGIAGRIEAKAPNAIVVNVANPLDVITEQILRTTGFPRERVIGMAGVLDSARFRAFLALELGVARTDVQAMVLGGHGDTMVPLLSGATVSGVPVTDVVAADRLAAVVERTRKAGAEVVGLLKTGSAFVSPAASAVEMIVSILTGQERLVSACVRLEGEYGFSGITLGVPVVLGRGGLHRIVEVKLSEDERAALERSAEAVRTGIAALD